MAGEAGFRGPAQWTLSDAGDSWTRNYRWQCRLTVTDHGGGVWAVSAAAWEGEWRLPDLVCTNSSLERAQRLAELRADAFIGPHDWEKEYTFEFTILGRDGHRQRLWARSHSVSGEAFALHLGPDDEVWVFPLADIASVSRGDERLL